MIQAATQKTGISIEAYEAMNQWFSARCEAILDERRPLIGQLDNHVEWARLSAAYQATMDAWTEFRERFTPKAGAT